jgi:hypothetical protein
MRGSPSRGLASVALLSIALGGTARASNVSPGADPPNISGTWLNRESTTLKDLKGMTVLVEFWGTH